MLISHIARCNKRNNDKNLRELLEYPKLQEQINENKKVYVEDIYKYKYILHIYIYIFIYISVPMFSYPYVSNVYLGISLNQYGFCIDISKNVFSSIIACTHHNNEQKR